LEQIFHPAFSALLIFFCSYCANRNGTFDDFYCIYTGILLSAALYLFNYYLKQINGERKFYSIPATPDQMNNISNYLLQLGWSVSEVNQNVIVARTNIALSSWGDTITIIKTENELLFNSRPIKDGNSEHRFSKNFWALYELLNSESPIK